MPPSIFECVKAFEHFWQVRFQLGTSEICSDHLVRAIGSLLYAAALPKHHLSRVSSRRQAPQTAASTSKEKAAVNTYRLGNGWGTQGGAPPARFPCPDSRAFPRRCAVVLPCPRRTSWSISRTLQQAFVGMTLTMLTHSTLACGLHAAVGPPGFGAGRPGLGSIVCFVRLRKRRS